MFKKISKDVVFILVLLIIVSLFFIFFFKQDKPAAYSKQEIDNNINILKDFNYSKVEAVENQIKKLERTESIIASPIGPNLSNAQYQKIFNDCIIVGDSITEGLTAYGYLNEETVISKIGASLLASDDLFNAAADLAPTTVFFALGMNDTGYYEGKGEGFAARYKEVILAFQKRSPNTTIYINGILPPSDDAIASHPNFGRYLEYNKALEKLCKKMDIGYIDNSDIIKSNPKFYGGDGVHVSSTYYPLWLNNMIMKAGL
ncbi:MAG: SGNH/GDSL hydrolase family protein [Anaerovoracaceae bacterium]